jgi:hypothetical protein
VKFLDIYQRLPGLVLGFHGCDSTIGEALLADPGKHLSKSANAYDWLGGGIYFWENDPQRALEFAQAVRDNPKISKGKIENPFVIGAVIELGLCCNLLDRRALKEIYASYSVVCAAHQAAGAALPVNGAGRRMRFLDCHVIDAMHNIRANQKVASYDTVRGAIWEGGELFPGAAIQTQNHVQIAVRNTSCIKGYFRPLTA